MNIHPPLKLVVAGLATLVSLAVFAGDAAQAQRVGERCWQDVRVLASDAMEGRRSGSKGHRRAAEFVAAEFRKAGLKPGGQGAGDAAYLQPVQLEMRQINEQRSSLHLIVKGEATALELGDDAGFLLRGNFERQVDAPLVFLGHGLRMPEHGVDDLAGLDLKGKIVVAFNSAPTSVPGAVGAHHGSAAERWKVYGAAGAVGMVLIPNPFSMDLPWPRAIQARLEPFMVLRGLDDQFVGQKLWVTFNPTRLAKLLQGTPHKAEDLLVLLKDGKSLPHFDLPARLSAVIDAKVSSIESENVVGILPGSDPVLRDEYVVLSGHLDHLGVKEQGPEANEGDRLFNGALDNAAGIAVMLQIARDLEKQKAPRRSIVFAAVTAEEMGLLGSRAYAARARAAGQKIVANLNSDMFLPLYPMKQLVVFGLEESDLADDARAVAQDLGVEVQSDPQPQRNRFIRSDQYSFIRMGIPSLATKIGVLPDSPEADIERKWLNERYHAVGDDLDQPVDIAAIGAYQELVKRLAVRVANRAEKPRWYPASAFAKLH
jgi:Zn-dependent M28 family amino/carboxypeptidase